MKRFISLLLTVSMVCSLPYSMTSFTVSAARERELPTVSGSILQDATYVVLNDTTIYGLPGTSALIVSGNVTITIRKGVTLTVIGGDAVGTMGAGAGIEVPEGSSLTINGEGTLEVTGGSAAVGSNGGYGGNGAVYDDEDKIEHLNKGKDWCYSGAGGKGGNGGGGAGAGIGGKGGNGGLGGDGGSGLSIYANTSADSSGLAGSDGTAGSKGTGCGNVSICKTLTYTIKGGSAYTTPSIGGRKGNKGSYEWYFTYIGFGGGGGGAGGNGFPGAGIGSGGSGGSGGGGGGSGIIIHWYYTSDIKSCVGTGYGGKGGNGYGNGGNDGFSETTSNNDNRIPGAGGNSASVDGGNGVENQQVNYYELTANAVPPAKTGFIYDGEQKTGVDVGTGYTITENTATNAGSYTATAKLCKGYHWSDGSYGDKKIPWSIAKQTVAVPMPVSLCHTGMERVAFPEHPLYYVENGAKTAVGTYVATLTLKDKTNYRWAVNGEDTGIATVSFVIHDFIDNNKDDKCDRCFEKRHLISDVRYIDRTVNSDNTVSSKEKICVSARRVSDDDTVWSDAGATEWYVVNENVSLSNRLTVKGNVCIILTDGTTLTANKGIAVEGGSSIRFYAQSDDEEKMGALKINATGNNAGVTAIGGNNGDNGKDGFKGEYKVNELGYFVSEYVENLNGKDGGDGGDIGDVYFCGGNILLESERAVCIGGGNGGNGGNGCKSDWVDYDTAWYRGYRGGNGGKGGNGGNTGDVYVYGGKVSLKSKGAACIGGGNGGNGGSGADGYGYNDLTGNGGAAGNGGDVGKVKLYGGTVSLKSDSTACVRGSKGGIGGKAGHAYSGSREAKNGGNGTDKKFGGFVWNISKAPAVKAGATEQNANNVTAYGGQPYFSVHYHSWNCIDPIIHECSECGLQVSHTDNGKGICTICNGKICQHRNFTVTYKWNDAYDICTATKHCNDCNNDVLTEKSTDIEIGKVVKATDCQHYDQTPITAKFANFNDAKTVINGDRGPHIYENYICKYCPEEDAVNAQQDAINAIDEVAANSSDAAICVLTAAAKTAVGNAEKVSNILQLRDYWVESIGKLEHEFSPDWSFDKNYHWHAATCAHTYLRGDKAEHTFDKNGICTVCGYDGGVPTAGSVFSEASFWGIVVVAVVVLGGVAALVIVKKKKKPVS